MIIKTERSITLISQWNLEAIDNTGAHQVDDRLVSAIGPESAADGVADGVVFVAVGLHLKAVAQ